MKQRELAFSLTSFSKFFLYFQHCRCLLVQYFLGNSTSENTTRELSMALSSSGGHNQLKYFTVTIHYGGEFKLVPRGQYIGGLVEKFEGIDFEQFDMSCLNSLADQCRIKRFRRFYALFNKGFILLCDDKSLTKYITKQWNPSSKELCVYIEGEFERAPVVINEVQTIEKPFGSCDPVVDDHSCEFIVDDDVYAADESIVPYSDCELDSDCDSDWGEDKVPKERVGGSKHKNSEDYDPRFEVNMTFPTKDVLKAAIHAHGMKTMRSLDITKNDKVRMYGRCATKGCEWRINARRIPSEPTYVITSYMPEHMCIKTFKCKNVKVPALVKNFITNFRTDPNRKVEGWRLDTVDKLRVDISRDQAYRTKKNSLKLLEGDPNEQYKLLWDYREELLRSNPGSNVILDSDDNYGEWLFRGFYVCFHALKQGFMAGCRPFLGVDGAHLSGPHKGVLLTAVGIDPDNKPYPIAYAVVESETRHTWTWFLSLLKGDLGIVDTKSFTLMSDKQKGLILAIGDVFEGAEHRFCIRHLWGDAYKIALYKASNSTAIDMFNIAMKELETLDHKTIEWLSNKSPEQWSKAFFRTSSKCDLTLNNGCECFNSMILHTRDKAILTMLEQIREYLVKRLQSNRDEANKKWKGKICPEAMDILQRNMEQVGSCSILKCDDFHFQITLVRDLTKLMYNVSFEDYSCTCGKWQLTGIPCYHALYALVTMGFDPIEFVHPYYKIDTYKEVYGNAILGVNGSGMWERTNYMPPLPPEFKNRSGRPSKLRRRGQDEPQSKKKDASKKGPPPQVKRRRIQSTLKCRFCGLLGHNIKTCQLKKAKEIEKEQMEQQAQDASFADAFLHVVQDEIESRNANKEQPLVLESGNADFVENDLQNENADHWTNLPIDETSQVEPTDPYELSHITSDQQNHKQKLRPKLKVATKNNVVSNQESTIGLSSTRVTKNPIIIPPLMPKTIQDVVDEPTEKVTTNRMILSSQAPVFVPGPSPSQQIGQKAGQWSQSQQVSCSSAPSVMVNEKHFVSVLNIPKVLGKLKNGSGKK